MWSWRCIFTSPKISKFFIEYSPLQEEYFHQVSSTNSIYKFIRKIWKTPLPLLIVVELVFDVAIWPNLHLLRKMLFIKFNCMFLRVHVLYLSPIQLCLIFLLYFMKLLPNLPKIGFYTTTRLFSSIYVFASPSNV